LLTNSKFNLLLQNILLYLIALFFIIVMSISSKIKEHQNELLLQYKQLIEDAYNFKQTDSALSDISEYRALKLLEELNRLNFLSRDPFQKVS
jgi:predicted Holliday junction resolvase-like endonuclease